MEQAQAFEESPARLLISAELVQHAPVQMLRIREIEAVAEVPVRRERLLGRRQRFVQARARDAATGTELQERAERPARPRHTAAVTERQPLCSGAPKKFEGSGHV